MRSELHLSTRDLDDMPYHQFVFFAGLINAKYIEQNKAVDKIHNKQK